MSKNVQPTINLEITVPHIALPLSKQHWQQVGEHDQRFIPEEVVIMPLDLEPGADIDQHDEHTAEVSFDSKQTGRCAIFQVKDVAAHTFLLQILRGQREQLRPTDELAFTLEFHDTRDLPRPSQVEHTSLSGSTSIPPKLVSGLNTIVIFLDEEGKPGGYSIDGAES